MRREKDLWLNAESAGCGAGPALRARTVAS